MGETKTYERYLTLRRELRRALASRGKWTALPGLLDELGRLRREHDRRFMSAHGESAWIDRFSRAVRESGRAVEPEQAHNTARALWPWVGAYEPEALPRGLWEALPRSHA